MKKYKLIKEYPGSPSLGQIALPYTDSKNQIVHYIVERNQKKDCDYIAIPKKHVEDNPDYWQEENDIWYVVLLRDGAFRNAWEIIKVQEDPSGLEHKKYFKSRIEAEHFILYNKPCLSINEIGNSIPCTTLDRLIRTVKSKL
jgi:hypothetical protein